MLIGLITGLLAGYIASVIQRGYGSGLILNLVFGLLGGLVGGWLFSLIGFRAYSWLGELLTAIVGAVVVLWVFQKLKN